MVRRQPLAPVNDGLAVVQASDRPMSHTEEVVMKTNTETAINELPRRKHGISTPNKPAVNKSDLILRALGRKSGACMDELCKLTGWQPHSVRGFLSGTVRKKLAVEVTRQRDARGVNRYCIVKPSL